MSGVDEGRPDPPFARVRVRTVVLLMVGVAAAVEGLRQAVFREVVDPWWDPAASLLFQLGMGGLLVGYLRRGGVSVRGLVGRPPAGWWPWALAWVAAPLLLLSLGSAALLYSALAALAPGTAAALEGGSGADAAVPTGAVLVAALAGVAAAGMEELLFRGVLLSRWERRWGVWGSALASSAAFALLHLDPVGAFVFGMAMCCLYLRTGSLLVPMLAHALNNTIVALSDLGEAAEPAASSAGAPAPDWGAAVLALVLAAPALAWFFRACPPRREWRLPYPRP